jgi:hypothetical protein
VNDWHLHGEQIILTTRAAIAINMLRRVSIYQRRSLY